ncbi:MAG: rhodanese-like domain-containing protein [Deltaproteobacteria bacterium]|nr:rhodanese-like domain-containing protein [Deltaproteobacteria bacterium]
MNHRPVRRIVVALVPSVLGLLSLPGALMADPNRYPQYAQQTLPKEVTPEFIYLNQVVDEVTAKKKPLIVDVRTSEEFKEAHILGSVSIPLSDFSKHLTEIPRDRLIVLY